MAEMLTLTFLLYKIYILCFLFFFNLKLTLYYCEVLLISVKPIVNNKDIDDYCFVFGCSSASKNVFTCKKNKNVQTVNVQAGSVWTVRCNMMSRGIIKWINISHLFLSQTKYLTLNYSVFIMCNTTTFFSSDVL